MLQDLPDCDEVRAGDVIDASIQFHEFDVVEIKCLFVALDNEVRDVGRVVGVHHVDDLRPDAKVSAANVRNAFDVFLVDELSNEINISVRPRSLAAGAGSFAPNALRINRVERVFERLPLESFQDAPLCAAPSEFLDRLYERIREN